MLVADPEKLLYTVVNPARGLMNKRKREQKGKSGSATPPLLVRRKIYKKIMSYDYSTHVLKLSATETKI